MLAQWTGDVVGKLHIYEVSYKELAKEAGLHEKYLSAILNCHRTSKSAEVCIKSALERIIAQKGDASGGVCKSKE